MHLICFLFLLLSWQDCADVAKHTDCSWCLYLGSFSRNWVRAGTCIISAAKNRWALSWGPFMATEETCVIASSLWLLCCVHLVMVIWAELKARSPNPIPGAEPGQALQSKTPGLSLQQVEENLLHTVEPLYSLSSSCKTRLFSGNFLIWTSHLSSVWGS